MKGVLHFPALFKTRAKSSYGTCDEARRAKSEEIIRYEL